VSGGDSDLSTASNCQAGIDGCFRPGPSVMVKREKKAGRLYFFLTSIVEERQICVSCVESLITYYHEFHLRGS